ncbi:Hexokinase 3 [Hibiscus syriacus]|uniref:Hexokinase 3 n=1 Tax=Hibiscus syriacus TaxID=106335 RepID=A0A6A2Y317_HIBSY|nr:WEB family protein At1g75720-like [Hibiscus syriacus]KAE8666429.1 Hexokinase 3 [Hibiscus syriacus]
MDCEGGPVMIDRAEIDTRAPFNCVKEAVALFGDTVLAAHVPTTNFKDEIHGEKGPSRLGTVTAELEETKYKLEKAREESMLMANCMCALKEELERTKRELEEMKEREIEKLMMEFEIEHVKIAPGSARYELNEEGGIEFQKKRYVTFANQPCLTRVTTSPQAVEKLARHPSLRKKKRKPLIPLIGGLFSKKK